MKDNTLIFGFKDFSDLLNSAFGFKYFSATAFFSIVTTINAFLTQYIYDDAKAVYFLVFLIAFDAFTGIWKAFKHKIFRSSRLPRILVIMVLYVSLLGISWNAARFSSFYFWLPSVVYGGMIGTLMISIAENIMLLGFIPKELYYNIKERIASYFSIENIVKNTKNKKKK